MRKAIIELLNKFTAIHLFFIMLLSIPISNILAAIFRWDLFISGSIYDFVLFCAFGIGALIGFNTPFMLTWFNKKRLINYLSQ